MAELAIVDLDTDNTRSALDDLGEEIDDFWVVLHADDTLDLEDKARITLEVEEAEDRIKAARKIVQESLEGE